MKAGVHMSPTGPPYQTQFLAEAVRSVRESGKPMSQSAENLGVSAESLRKWVRQAEIDAGGCEGLTTAERDGLARLRRELRILRGERDIPEKVAASLAKAAGQSG